MAPKSTRSTSNASIAFGMFNIQCSTHSATSDHDLASNSYHVHPDGSYSRIEAPFICKACGVSCRGETVKGYEVPDPADPDGKKKKIVIVTQDELDAIDGGAGKDYEISEFVAANLISPVMLETPYFLVPNVTVKRGRKTETDPKKTRLAKQSYYALLNEMVAKQLVGIVEYASRGKTHLAVLRPWDDVFVIQNISWPDEIRAHDFDTLAEKVEVDPRMAKQAALMVESYRSEDFDPANYRDKAQDQLAELIDTKASGGEWVAPVVAAEEEADDEIGDLLAKMEAAAEAKALEKSVKAHPAGKKIKVTAKSA